MSRINLLLFFFAMGAVAAVSVFLTLYFKPVQPEPFLSGSSDRVTVYSGSQYNDERVETRLFFLTSDHQQLAIERREIPATTVIKQKVESAVRAWLAGPSNKELVLPVPSGTTLLGVFWDSGERMMYVNFNETLIQQTPGHSLAEWGSIYALVNTVAAQSPVIGQVWILVNGQPVPDEHLVWDWSLPFRANDTFVKRSFEQQLDRNQG